MFSTNYSCRSRFFPGFMTFIDGSQVRPSKFHFYSILLNLQHQPLKPQRGLAKDYFCIIASRGLWIYKHLSPKCVLVKLLTPIVYGKQSSFNVGIVFFSWCRNYLIVCVVLIILRIYLATKLVI